MSGSSFLTRREMIGRSVALAAVALGQAPLSVFGQADDVAETIPFLDPQPKGRQQLQWDQLESWITPGDQLFAVSHYGTATVDPATYALEISGLVKKPLRLSLDELRLFKPRTVVATLECSGNSSSPGFMGAIGNGRWTGVPLRVLLDKAGPVARAVEVVFYGADEKVEKIRDKDYLQNFARALPLTESRRDEILVAYELNGKPLTAEHGAPARLVVPGWFGIAWVKWLKRVELLDRRFMGKWMAREYVTIRGEELESQTVWRETSVGPIDVKSAVARVVRMKKGGVRLQGAAWTDGTPLEAVEVRIDGGPWRRAGLDHRPGAKFAWKFWHFNWDAPAPGEHTVVSRARDAAGRTQPAPDDPSIRMKRTYWEANQQWPRRIRI